jgi:hypothetical protein
VITFVCIICHDHITSQHSDPTCFISILILVITCLLHRCRQFGANALYLAISTARPDVVQHLLDSGADIKAKDDVSSMTVTAQHSTLRETWQ